MAETGKKKQTGKSEPKIPAAAKKPQSKSQSTSAKKPAAQSKPAKTKQVQDERDAVNKQTLAIIFAAAGAFLLAVALIEGESAWLAMHNYMFAVLGVCAYIIPFILFYVSFIYAKDKPGRYTAANLFFAGATLILLCSSVHIIKNPPEFFKTTTVSMQISMAWEDAASVKGGGVIGALIGGGIAKFFGKTGAVVTALILLAVSLLLFTGLSLPVIVSAIGKPLSSVRRLTNERMEEVAQRREEYRRQQEEEELERQKENSLPPEAENTPGAENRKKGPKIPEIGGAVKSNGKLAEPPMPPVINTGAAATAVPQSVAAGIAGAQTAAAVAGTAAAAKAAKTRIEKTPAEPKTKKTEKKPADKKTPPAEAPANKGDYKLPPIDCLDLPKGTSAVDFEGEIERGSRQLVETLESFKIHATVTAISRGPSVTRYELVPEAGIRINRITALSDDIALRLAAKSVRIEAPIPGKAAIGIEVPNSAKSMVSMREVIDTDVYRAGSAKSKLNVALGKDITGNIITADLAKMPHLLVAGTTGSGKSVCLNTMIVSLLYNAAPDEVKLLMIDPKMVEFTIYNGISHLQVPVVSNPRKAAGALSWAVSEMEKRYKLFAENRVKDIKGYNRLCEAEKSLEKMPHIVIFIDELSDLMMASPKEVEDSICRLAQMARAAGMHMVIATQRPSVDVITGIIRANIPSRIALYVSSQIDSRIIIDQSGAEKLLGNGDMLFNPVGTSKPHRVQGCYISEEEVERIVSYIKAQGEAVYSDETIREIDARAASAETKKGYDDADGEDALDPMFDQAAEAVITAGQASTTMLQKKLKLGYARASRVMDQLEERGIVGPSEGAKPRQVLISQTQWYEMQALAEGGAGKNVQLEFNTAEIPAEPEYEDEEDLTDVIDEEDDEEYEEQAEETEAEPEAEPDDFADIYEEDEDDDDGEYAGVTADEEPAEEETPVADEYEDIYSNSADIPAGQDDDDSDNEITEETPEEPAEEIPVEEIPAEEIPAEEIPVEEIPVESLDEKGESQPSEPAKAEEAVQEIEVEVLEPDTPDTPAGDGEEEYYEEADDFEPVSIDDLFSDDDFYDDSSDDDFFSE